MGVLWKDDVTNESMAYFRNRVRHQLLPEMEGVAQRDVIPMLLRTARMLGEENSYWADVLPSSFPEKVEVRFLRGQKRGYQRRYIRGWLGEAGVLGVGFQHVEDVIELVLCEKRAKVNLPNDHFCRRTQGYLYLEK